MKILAYFAITLSRILVSSYFIGNSLIKIFNWSSEERQLYEAMVIWEAYIPHDGMLFTIYSELLQAPTVVIGLSFGVYLVLGVLFLLGIRKGFAAFLLGLALAVSAVLFHPFWLYEGENLDRALMAFILNFALIGGLLSHVVPSQSSATYYGDN